MSIYLPFDCSINLGKSDLSPETAYLLGAVLSANENFIKDNKKYWVAPVRHNYGQASESELSEHKDYLCKIVGRSNGKILPREVLVINGWFPNNKKGFGAVFESSVDTDIELIIREIDDVLRRSENEVKNAFVIGAFDGRGSLDINKATNRARHLVIDCDSRAFARLLEEFLSSYEIHTNSNFARDRVEGGNPRKPQFRVSGHEAVVLFSRNIGLISPVRFNQLFDINEPEKYIVWYDSILYGLKRVSSTQIDNMRINIAQEDQIVDEEMDEQLSIIDIQRAENEEPMPEYSGQPKEKGEMIEVRGHHVYQREKKVAANALRIADYKCEISEIHPSFVRRNSELLYTEPHHLVPMMYSDLFDVSLDVEENIVSLCSNCHNQLHYGKNIRVLLDYLFQQRYQLLQNVGINVAQEDLYKMYNA